MPKPTGRGVEVMRGIRIIGSALAVALIVAANVTATASAAKLTLSEGGVALAVGSRFAISGVDNLFIETSIGDVECVDIPEGAPTFGLYLEVITNAKGTDELGVLGPVRDPEGCRGGPLGHATVQAFGLGLLKVRATGQATEGPVTFRIEWERGSGPEGHAECFFESAKLKGANDATVGPQVLGVEFNEQRLKLDRSFVNSGECPKTATMSFFLPSSLSEEREEDSIEEQI
jgi:hypothetical protein